ncbi:tripartite tricarboxylate transporter substrate binding protein [Siccirubricoccus sp. KC 17139]|uniref:Tripartite tricarboxylate transporter substrate binding protein n=1 Tax=Siccirubricoccus soli TaxID=2899147 RepID=A0ABT1DAS8_9PROT|nr:tripartite tricarboxylate transporter substrate binding protein [Siccirubricoccus soli]MCO6419052.1 tripartite tricarboxylate transporter substrate binding protein [Siccirubricoccus soli]MCP2685187.1 tripartite tricarboxylate transporter substrate binding protein [Siccirubricoccus soli]
MRRPFLLLLALLAWAGPARAWPERPLQLLVGFAPGGNIDIAARMLAPFLERRLGAPVQVVNRPGAGGMLMLNEAAAARPDGHVLAFASFPALVTALHDSAPRYRLDSFFYAGMLTDEPYTLFVGAGTPYRSLAELVAAARAAPESIAIAGAGAGGAPQLALMQLERVAGVRFTWVPMQGAAQALSLVQGGHAAGAVSTVSLTVKQHAAGEVRILGLMDRERWDRVPDLPTMREQGFDAVAGAARGVLLPAGAPAPVQARLAEALAAIAADPEFHALAERDYVVLRHMGPAEMRAFVEAEDRRYAALWRASPWK